MLLCGIGAKPVAHLMQYHLLQWEVAKVKQLMTFNMTLTVLNLANVPTQYQLPTPYGFRDIPRTRFYRSRSLRQGQRSNQGHVMTLHTYTP